MLQPLPSHQGVSEGLRETKSKANHSIAHQLLPQCRSWEAKGKANSIFPAPRVCRRRA